MPYLLLSLLLISSQLIAAEWQSIEGQYALTPEHYIDPPADEPKDSHLRFRLTGETAKDLYQAIKTEVKEDLCTGEPSKTQENMQCIYYQHDDQYECHFSINIPEQKIAYGLAC